MPFDKYKQNMIMFNNKFVRERNYWREKIGNSDEPAFLCRNNDGGIVKKEFSIDGNLFNKIRKICRDSSLAYYAVFVSVVQYVLSRYLGKEKVYILSPILKNSPNIKEINNSVILSSVLCEESSFIELLKSVSKEINTSNTLSNFPVIKVIEEFQVEKGDLSLDKYIVSCKNIHDKIKNTNFQFHLQLEIKEDNISLELFVKDAIGTKNILEHIINVLKEFANNPSIKLKDIRMLSLEEEKKLLYNFNDTKAEYAKDITIQELFERQAKLTPNNIAIEFESKKLTYKELNKKSNSLARVLRSKGVKSNKIVGIAVERSLQMIIGILGILKAGGAYLPIDPSYPKERIEYMLSDSGANIVLTMENVMNNIEFKGEFIDLLDENIFKTDSCKLEVINNPKDLIYMIYTSGTTGKPKGVMVKRDSFHNLVKWYSSEFNMSKEDNILLMSSVGFDLSQKNIYAPLIVGGKLTLANKGLVNYEFISKIIKEKKITIINCAPSAFNPIVDLNEDTNYEGLKSLRHVFLGGEIINIGKLAKWRNSSNCNVEIVNTYGPTECTDIATFYRIKNEDYNSVPIGKPINNVKVYVLNKSKKLLPIGVCGELYISGEGISKGYLNKDDLTKERFIDNPFDLGEKMYKTGDLARWMNDGNIHYIGRVDNQVKIRGFRIELSEIEEALLRNEAIHEATVIIKNGADGTSYICSYIVCEGEIKELNLQNYLKKSLPDYMIPTFFIPVEKIPITINGKVDKRALPEPNLNSNLGEYIAPRDRLEENLVNIWTEVLGVEQIGINDNFFKAGGNSLKLAVLVSKIHRELLQEVPVIEVFKHPTIEGIGRYIKSKEKSIYKSIDRTEEKDYYELSSAEKRMYMLQQFDLKSIAYNLPNALEVRGKLDIQKVEEVFLELIKRHESLRTSFETINDRIIRKVNIKVEFSIKYIENTVAQDEIVKFIRPFDLSKAPLLRVLIIKVEEEKYIIMYDMHHIIADGRSMEILIEEFVKIYSGERLEDLKIQYKDYARWQNSLLESEKIKDQEKYWMDRFSDEIPVLNLQTDFSRSTIQEFNGDSVHCILDKDVTKSLKNLAKDEACTMHMVFLSAINILLSKYSGQEDILLGIPVAGRNHIDLENIMGMFVNTLVMRNYPVGEKKYVDFLSEVKENALKAYENQEYQFEDLVDKLNINRDLSRNPLFDVMFTLENIESDDLKIQGLTFENISRKTNISKFDLTFDIKNVKGEVQINIEYRIALFKKETIERMLKHFENILKGISIYKRLKIHEIEMLSESERYKLIYEFNDTFIEYPKDKTVYQLFEEQVDKIPNNVAVIYKNSKFTYKELNSRANSLARILVKKGVKADKIVGIIGQYSLEIIVGILAIVKAGGAYLPIDSEYPEERIKYVLQDSKAEIVLAQEKFIDKLDFDGEIINLNDEKNYKHNNKNLGITSRYNNLIYVIYTSGSTGAPKGVLVEHRNVNRLVKSTNYITLGTEQSILHTSSIAFDVSVFEVWGSLLNGGKLYLTDKDKILNPDTLKKILYKYNITTLWLTSALFTQLSIADAEIFKPINNLLVGGDALSPKHINLVRKNNKGLKIINGYGPTENTTFSTTFLIEKYYKDSIPIGKPISNSTAYILSKNGEICPIGVVGELCVGGEGVARGYLNRDELTQKKFVDNPFLIGKKMYRTGDLARWISDGNIEFCGRIDNQVKIRGFRIELGEIEKNLLADSRIKEAIVIDRKDKFGDKFLCAYLVTDKKLDIKDIKCALKKKLPGYMIPTYFVQLDKFKLTNNGKIDKRSLPDPNIYVDTNREYEAPRNKIESKLVEIWQQVLMINNIGINDNFFELGGNSLKSIILMNNINKTLGTNLSVTDVFDNVCIADLAKIIFNKDFNKIKTVEEVKILKDSSSNKNIFFIHDGSGEITAYVNLVNKLNNDYNYLGIDANEFKKGIPINITIEEIAEKYIGYINKVQKDGPYYVAGWSLGGTIAFEICRQLEKNGKEVGKLILIDSYISKPKELNLFQVNDEKKLVSELLDIKIHNSYDSIEELYSLHEKEILKADISRIYHKLKSKDYYQIDKLVPYWNNRNMLELVQELNLIRSLIRASENYYPKSKIKSSIDFIKAKDSIENSHTLWEDTVQDTVKYVKIKGDHFSIFNENIKQLSNEVEKILSEF
ncbi:non-ribosomal peptide synthetase [Clostridium felsineum]|uniref:non-ribosomal peptide synthetase n=1 Tax=Clostridium felsineum TaxID=36839 RepID=UPI00098C2BCC|nr:non-ribosomal peptide synthetase [Clostridium felsineum]URZ00318.1 Gramicidin S synthase 2 [Clostridium felsineum]